MANVILSTNPFDMSTWDLSDIADGTVTSHSATKFTVNGTFHYSIAGSGFTTFDTNGFPTDGTITSVTIETFSDHAATKITGISISASDFMGFVDANNLSGLETALFSGNDSLTGGTADDVLLGLGGNDTFNVSQGGNDTVNGGDGDDSIAFKGAFTAADSVDGGAGNDKVTLSGDYSAGITFGASTMVNVETLVLAAGNNYNLSLNATTDTSGQTLAVSASGLSAANHVTIDGSAVTGSLRLVGGAGDDTLIGGSGANTFNGQSAGNDTIIAGTGDNTILDTKGQNTFQFSTWTAGDNVNGTGNLVFDGDFSAGVTIGASQLTGVNSSLILAAGHSYNVTLGAGAHIAAIDATALLASDSATIDASALTTQFGYEDGRGNDHITGSATAKNTFVMNQSSGSLVGGGNDTLVGGSASDTFTFGSAFTAADSVNGVSGVDGLSLRGTYDTPIVLGAASIQNITLLAIDVFTAPFSMTTNDANVAAGATMTVSLTDGDAPNFSTSMTFNAVAETDGKFIFNLQDDVGFTVTGGAGDDVFNLLAHAGGTFNTASRFDGGGGHDTMNVNLGGNVSIVFGSHGLQNFEQLNIVDTAVATNDANVAAGHTLDVNLSGGRFDGEHETNGRFDITGNGRATGGAGADTITLAGSSSGNAIAAYFTGGGGADHLTTNASKAEFIYNAASDSTGANYDTITNFHTGGVDLIKFATAVSAVDATVTSGALSTATFDADLAAAVGASQLGAGHAVVFTPNSGSLSGDAFLVIDANGTAGYQAGQDLVILLDHSSSLTFTTASFTTS